MNITVARKGLMSCVKNSFSLSYSDGEYVETGETIKVCGRRYMSHGETNWKIDDIYRGDTEITIEESVGEDKGRQQLLLKMTVDTVSKRNNSISNISTVERSEIVKNKNYILNTVIQLWNIGWHTKYLGVHSNDIHDINNDFIISEKLRPINKNDFKVTTVSSKGKSMHLGRSSVSQDYKFKLGVNWIYWHRMDGSEKLKVLTHELCHCLHPHHKKSFYEEHAKFIAELTKSNGRKKRVELLFDEEINWNKLKARTLDGVHNQPKEIDITDYKHRREACNSVIDSLEDIIDYQYAVGEKFYLHPPNKVYFDWQYNTLFNNEVSNDLDKFRPNNVKSIKVRELDYDDDYTDEDLYDYLESMKNDTYSTCPEYVFPEEDIPHIDENNNVIKNDKIVSLYNRLIMDSKSKGFSEDIEIFVFSSD